VAALQEKIKTASSGTSVSSAALARAQQEVVQAKREGRCRSLQRRGAHAMR